MVAASPFSMSAKAWVISSCPDISLSTQHLSTAQDGRRFAAAQLFRSIDTTGSTPQPSVRNTRIWIIPTNISDHAYSFNLSLTIPPYFIPEGAPLCYMWGNGMNVKEKPRKTNQASGPRISRQPAVSLTRVPDVQLVDLTLYANNRPGTFFDSYLTTRPLSEVVAKGYTKVVSAGSNFMHTIHLVMDILAK